MLEDCAIVMAHPDDEALWASSILAQAWRVVLCFGDVPSKPTHSAGRRQAIAAFPREVEHLALSEAEVFDSADWPVPAETPQGLAVRRGKRYRANHARLVELLTERLRGCRNVVTHNPWGEYGHEEHVQVLRAVEAASCAVGFRIWVSCYYSNKSEALMRRHLARLGPPTPPLATDSAFGAKLQRLYTEAGCWTWFDDYVWPESEVFYPWPGPGEAVAPRPGSVHLVNFVWLDWPKRKVRGPLPLRLARRFAGAIAPPRGSR
jgi:hypothetical protein